MVNENGQVIPNHLLRAARKERGWTKEAVAKYIGAPLSLDVASWENGTAFPSAHYVEKLCHLLGKSARELGLLQHQVVTDSDPACPWNVPFPRNPFFTGRDDLLNSLHNQLSNDHRAALTQSLAITGLGGIGKTQTAVEYAHRYREKYQGVFWVRAASTDTIITDYVALAGLLALPGQDAQDQNITVGAVKRWLTDHSRWLLILDNADDLAIVADFLPPRGNGHTLLTTRAQATGKFAPAIAVEKMKLDEGIHLLLRRAKLLTLDAEIDTLPVAARTQAQAIVQALDGLPLAIDQAGAYIEETGCSLAEYLELYQQYRSVLLNRQSSVSPDYPFTVASTWSLSFQKVKLANPAAADLLRLCAFLDPDLIPEAIITDGAPVVGDVLGPVAVNGLLLNEAIQVLRSFSLIKRDAEAKLLNMHRLVQTVLKDGLGSEMQREWAERAVRAVNAAFPQVTFNTWTYCELLLPHAQACTELIEQYEFCFPEAARLLDHAGSYLRDRALYEQAMPLLQRALAICEHALGPDHSQTASTLNNLAQVYYLQGHYGQAETLLQRALAICEQTLGTEHLDTAAILYHLQWLYYLQGKYQLGEFLAYRTLAIREKALGPKHSDTADAFMDLALLYQAQGKYEQAEPLYQRALAIKEQALGSGHPDTASALNNLAYLYDHQGKYERAEPLYQRALAIYEQAHRSDHPDTAMALDNLARLYKAQGKYAQAEPLNQRALAIYEKVMGPHHPETAVCLNNLAELYHAQGRYAQAETLYQRALSIREQVLGIEHPKTSATLSNLARLYQDEGRYVQAESLYKRALALREQVLGDEHPDTATTLYNLAWLYWNENKYEQAELLHQRVLGIREKVLGPEHPDTATVIDDLGLVYFALGEYERAEVQHLRALAIREKVLHPEHPSIADTLNNLANLYEEQGRYEEAESLYQRALAIYMKVLGPMHPYIATTLDNLALVYVAQRRYTEAEPLHSRALAIFEQAVGPEHPDAAIALYNLAHLYHLQGQYEQAEPLYQRALTIGEQTMGAEHYRVILMLIHLAMLYRELGQSEQAEALYQRAMALREQAARPDHPATLAALKKYDEAKMQHMTGTRKPEVRATSTATEKVPATYAASLTAREVEVLRLLAQGLTSAQIAEQLTLSLLTVNTHVRSVYSKLGVSSRSAATRWAIEHKLV